MVNTVIFQLQNLCYIRQNKLEIELGKLKQIKKEIELKKQNNEKKLLNLLEQPAIFKSKFYKNMLGKTITPFELKKLDIELSKIKQQIENQKQYIENLFNELDSISIKVKEVEQKLKREIIKNEKYKYINA